MNLSILMGRITATPELRKTNSGLSVTSFSIAIDRRFRSGEERVTDFINCVAWRQTAEFICKYFQKGSMIAVDGTIQTRKYTDRNGNDRTATEVVVNNAYFTGSKRDSEAGGYAAPYPTEPQAPAAAAPSFSNVGAGDFTELTDDDDLPF